MGVFAADMAFNVNTGMLWQLDVGGSDCIHELDPIAMEATGNTYFVGGWNEDIIYHFDNSGNILEQVNVGLGISGLAYNPETQHLFVTVSDDADSSLHILDAADSFAEVDSFTADGFDSGAGLAIGCDGSLWAVDQDLQMVFQIDSGESASLCGGASGVWIAEEPATGVIPADGSIEVTVIFTALNTLELGEHYADVNISTSDPYSGSNFTESATMTVTLPSGYGQLSGDVTGLGYCDNDSYPLAGAEVTVAGMQLTTDANGHYFIYLDSSDNPYDVEAIAEGHIGETSSASIVEGDVVEVDFALRSDEPCISVAHDTMEATLEYGQSESFIMTLTNDGAGESFFEIGKYSTTPELRFLQSESTVIVSTRPDLTAIAKSDYVLSTYRDTSKHQSDTHVNKSQSDVAQKSVRSDLILTHSASQEILEANSVSCNDGTAHTDNSYFRVFDLEAFDINGDFDVTSVEFGIESAASAGSQPVTVNLYTLDDPDNFVFANLTPIGSADVDIPDQTLSIVTVPVEGTAPSGSILVVELFTPDGGTSNLFFAGSNTAGQTDYSYIAAAECGIAEPATLESIGFTMHLVMNVTGSASGGGSTDWLIPTPISGTIPADSSVDVDITFDALATLSVGSHYAMVTVDTADENLDFEAPAVLTIDCPTCGVLDGSIFDGNTGEPFEADIRITDNNEFDVTSFGDSYYMQVLPGVYDIIVSAEGYFVESKTVTVTTGMTTTTDFEMWLGPELSIEKLGPSISSGIIEYTLLVHNAGSLVTDVIITDTVPISTEYVSSSHDGYLDGNVVTWQFEDIDYDETIEVSFVVSVVDELMQAIRSGDLNIVGGGPADPDAYPWMLSLQMNGAGHFCGASLISDEWALTAAHCIEGGYWQPDYVVVGRYDLTTTDGEEIDVVEVIMHEDYGNSANDIGLMRLEHAPESPVPFIPMVTGDNDAVGVWATVIGWGALYSGGPSPDELYEVDVPIISNEDCNTSYPGQISDDMICAGDLENGGIDSCQGDSGGPFIVLDDAGGWEQAGIVSWGQGCAAPGYPGVYARTSYFIDWISETCDGCLSPDNRVFIFNYDYGVLADGLYTATGDPVVTLITDTATIDVNPMDIMAVQDTDSSTVQDLTIANIGNLDLDWEIEEDGAPVRSIIKTADESAAFARTAPAHVGRSAPIYNATYDDALGEQDEWLLSPEITADSATLSFWSMGSTYWCRDDNDNCDFAIWLVIGDPGDGDDIFVGLAEDSWIENWVWEQSVFDLTSALPDGTFRIGFQYDGQDAAQIGLDNIVLDTSGGSPPPSETIIEEGFEDGLVPPTDWTLEQFNANETWHVTNVSMHDGLYSAEVLYDEALGDQDEWLLSPEITTDSAVLSFWSMGSVYWCRDDNDNCDLAVWLVIGEPGDGDDIFVGLAEDSWTENWVWAESVFDLTSVLPDGTFRIGFQYDGQDAAQVGLDDILLEGAGDPPLPEICEEPSDIPWLSLSATSGTLTGGTETIVGVTLDSTGMDYGFYNANLCVTSNDPDFDLIVVPVDMVVQEPPTIELEKTVGLDPAICADTTEITVLGDTEVYYCYTVENTSDMVLQLHYLDDSELGVIVDDLVYDLAPAESLVMTASAFITETTVNEAIWTASTDMLEGTFILPTPLIATDMASATVIVTDELYDVEIVSDVDMLIGEPNETVTYTLFVTNTGNMPDVYDIALADNVWLTTVDALTLTLDAGVTTTLQVAVTIDVSATNGMTDTVDVTVTSQNDVTVADAVVLTTEAMVEIVEPEYGVEVVSDIDALIGEPGETVTYILSITNTGDVADTFDVTFAGNVWVTDGDADTLTLDAGASDTLNVMVTIDAAANDGDTDIVDVTVTSQNDDTIFDDVTLTTTAEVPAVLIPDINLVKTVGTDPSACGTETFIEVDAGTMVTYCYTVENIGDSILTSHTLVDNQLGALFTDKAFDLAPDETYVYTATAVIDDFTVNMATWFASDDAGNNVSASAQAYVTAIIAGQDLVIEKELNDYPLVNNDVTYWIYYYNNGDTSVDNVITITDILPDNVSYVSSYSYGSATLVATDTNIIWNVPSLSSYEAGYLEVTVMLNGSAGDDLVNVATIETDETDVNPENNIYTDTATIISTLGGISGNVTNASGDPLDHIIINIFVANDDGSQGDFIDWLSTDSNGDYSYNLTTGNYFVAFYDWYDSYYQPEFYDNAKTIFSATVVAVTAGETTTGIDAILEDPAASVASGSADSGYIINDPTTGLLGIWMPLGGETDLTITKTVTCDGDVTPTNVQLILTESDNTATSFSMTMAISDTYVATIPFNQIQNGELSISYDCGGETQTEVIGSITLIDPSGYITDAETGDPIEGAEVQLYKLEGWSPKVDKSDTRPQTCHTTATRDLISSEWENHPPAQTDSGRPANPNADPVEIAPPINPLYTDKDGYYRWDVTEGCWFVKVLKDDYMERISPAVGVTEAYPVTDLNLTLMKVTVPPTQTVPTRNMIYLPIVLKN
ncbi:MAG: hypothetical protein B6242_05205 [Anaerolineaceae bacterium 4572_78]|nr:MAG: hypothetical protein B6242_05205 [Anaerolineaceae bacterium 4572_78]